MTKKPEKAKKYLCVVCGRIFIDTSPKTFACKDCKKVLRELSDDVIKTIERKENENHETKH